MRNNIVFISLFFLIALSFSLTACEKTSKSDPGEVAKKFLDSVVKGEYEEAYSCISSEDKSVKTLDEFLSESKKNSNPLGMLIASRMKIKIANVTEEGGKAKVDLEITQPDLLGAVFGLAYRGKKTEDIERDLAKKIESESFPIKTSRLTIKLNKEQDGWKVVLGLKAKQDYIKAKQDYIKEIDLYDLKARYQDSYSYGRVPVVELKVKNNGNRTLKKVEVTVYFKDDNGNIIAEDSFHPVLVSVFSSGSDSRPLKPNYIRQAKFYARGSVPSEWKEGSVSAKITDIEFAD